MTAEDTRNSHIRFWIIAVLFIVSSINYASRATSKESAAANQLLTQLRSLAHPGADS